MSFPKYEAYQDSGVEWLGEVPEHWQVCAVKRKFTVELGKMLNRAKSVEDGITKPYLRAANIHWDKLLLDGLNAMEFSEQQLSRYQLKPGDLLVTEGGVTVGRSAIWEGQLEECYYQNSINRVRPQSEDLASTKFLLYWMHFLKKNGYVDLAADIATFGHLTQEKLQNLFVTLPPIEEQQKIASFLDHETARIDALIAEQERLIELLKEKRQAVISHAVTKGLDPTTPMKDSGVEWLGQVPAHWEVSKGNYVGELFGSESVPEDMVTDDGNLPFLKVGSLSSESLFIRSIDHYVDTSMERNCRPRSNFIAFPKRGAAIFLNKVNVVNVEAVIDPNLMGWEIKPDNNIYYFAHILKCRELKEIADVSTVPQINNKHIGPEKIPVPPSNEQNEIVDFLQEKLSQIDRLSEEATAGVSLLQERRSALISAAVTGKIDVRGWQPPASAAPAAALGAAWG